MCTICNKTYPKEPWLAYAAFKGFVDAKIQLHSMGFTTDKELIADLTHACKAADDCFTRSTHEQFRLCEDSPESETPAVSKNPAAM